MPETSTDLDPAAARRFLSPHRARYNVDVPEVSEKIAELRREVAANPTSRQFYQLGELLRRGGECHEAAQVLAAGLEHNPKYVAAWVSLGRAQLECGSGREAARALQEALELDRQNPVAWRLLGEANLAAGDRDQALTAFDRALELVPGDKALRETVRELADSLTGPAPAPLPGPAAPEPAPFSFALESPVEGSGDVFGAVAAPPSGFSGPQALPDDLFDLGGRRDEPLWNQAPVDSPFAWAVVEAEPGAPASLAWRETDAAEPAPETVEEPGSDTAAALPEAAPQDGYEPEAVETRTVESEAEPLEVAEPEVAAGSGFGAEPPLAGELAAASAEAEDAAAPLAAAEAAEPAAEEDDAAARTGPVAVEELREGAPGAPSGGPPATLTLARLYIQQQQMDLAVDTLERLTAVEPANQEARDLLDLVRDMMEPLPGGLPVLSVRERRIAALQRWLASLTLSHERTAR